MSCTCGTCTGAELRPRAVFVRANVTDNDGDVYRAAKWEKPETFDLYLQTPGTFPSFEEAFATLDEAFVEGKRFAEFAGCSLILELWDDTLEITPAQFHGIESAIIWEWLRARGWVGR